MFFIIYESIRCISTHWGDFVSSIGTEEMAHAEMICAIVHQLTRNLTPEEIQAGGFADYYVDHTLGIWPQEAAGEDLAAEQKARTTYDNILRLVKDHDVADPIRFLREREIVHYQRFGESLRLVNDELNSKNYYAFNPSYDSLLCNKK